MRSRTMRLSPQVNSTPDKEHYVTFPGGGRPREESTRGSRPTRGLRPSARTQAVQSVETGTGAHGWTASAPATLPGLQPAALSVQRALAPSAVTCSRFASRPSRCRPTGRRTFRRAAGSSLLPSRPDPLPTFVDNCDYPRNLQCCNACRSLNLLARISPSNVRANGPSSEVERQSLAVRRSRRRRAPSSSIIDLHLQDRPQGWDLDGFFERRRTTARVVTPLSCRPMSCLRTSRGRGQGHPRTHSVTARIRPGPGVFLIDSVLELRRHPDRSRKEQSHGDHCSRSVRPSLGWGSRAVDSLVSHRVARRTTGKCAAAIARPDRCQLNDHPVLRSTRSHSRCHWRRRILLVSQ